MIDIATPNPHALGVMILILVALVMFSRDKIPLETTALVVLISLSVGFTWFPYQTETGVLSATEFFTGFGHKALIAVCALMIVGTGLIRTGALEPVGRFLAGMWKRWPAVSLLFTLIITGALSAFINNTPIVVLLLPLLLGVAVRTGTSSSKTLLPMGFASIIGGMATTIGTSTNLLVVNVAADLGITAFDMFDFALPALIGGAVAVLYLWLIAPRLIPERQAPIESEVSRLYTAQLRLRPDSPFVDSTLAHLIEKTGGSLKVEKIQRGGGVFVTPFPDVVLRADDRITTTDTQPSLHEYARALGAILHSGIHAVDAEHPLSAEGMQIAEVAITTSSRLVNVKIGNARLQSRYGLRLLAFHRFEGSQPREAKGLDEVVLRSGDVLLVQSSPENFSELKRGAELLVLDGSGVLPKTKKAPIALATMVGVVMLAAFTFLPFSLPIEIAALLGALVLIVTGCLSWREAMNALSAQVILIIVSSLAMGAALMKTGGADYLAQLFLAITFGASPTFVLAGVMLLMALLTNVVSNNAAAVIGTPIAIGIAQRLGLPAEPFILAVLFGANLSFATPMAYQTNLLVMNAGGYKFRDFMKVGIPLMIILWIVLTTVLVLAYGL
ncbi:MAG: hypothetical protein L3J24_14500 [Xanthomonadales bacterium]|nr:hypothetical protein [Xanthomonadales bacterium]